MKIISVLFFLINFNSVARADHCLQLEPWFTEGHVLAMPTDTNRIRVERSHLEYELRKDTANSLYLLYLEGQLDRVILEKCLGTVADRLNFLATFYSVLFEQTLKKLEKSKSTSIQNFVKLYRQKFPTSTPLFRARGLFEESSDLAGYHRATGSIYMNFSLISPQDWPIIFIHETLHALDQQIWVGVEKYGNQELVAHFLKLSVNYKNYADLPDEERKQLRQWIMAGMDRGLLAEYRDWCATFIIYHEGKEEGLWNQREWAENVLKMWDKNPMTLNLTVFNFLDARSKNPTDGLFANALLRSALIAVREELRTATTPPSLFGLAAISAQ